MNLDHLNYYPLKDGKFPPSSAIMKRWSTLPESQKEIFQNGPGRDLYMTNKTRCRKELHKYYQGAEEGVNLKPIREFILTELYRYFDRHYEITPASVGKDWFDIAAMNVMEDMVIVHQPEGGEDRVIRIHLCQPYGWSAEWAIGKSFAEIHDEVKKADGRHVIREPSRMVDSLIRMSEPIQRVGALSFRPDLIINLHPDQIREDDWHWRDDQKLYLRFERQVVVPFPEIRCFLFTIRPYFVDVSLPGKIEACISALENVHKDSYPREWINSRGQKALEFLKGKKDAPSLPRYRFHFG